MSPVPGDTLFRRSLHFIFPNLAALSADFWEFQKSPAFFRRWFNQHSLVMQGLDSASGKFLAGMKTYIAEQGPEMLGKGYTGFVDRKVASGIGSVCFRLRLQDTAKLIAEELSPSLAVVKTGALHLLNIGGGPAMDSLNALILLQKAHPEWLLGRGIAIHVLNLDRVGPSFGARALAALLAPGAPLHGLDVAFVDVPYDWNKTSELQKVMEAIDPEDVVIGSSEGGLFEYGSDEAILANLQAIRTCYTDIRMIGSTFREDPIPHWLQTTSKVPGLYTNQPRRFTTQPRQPDLGRPVGFHPAG